MRSIHSEPTKAMMRVNDNSQTIKDKQHTKKGKVIVFSAPSGSGKSTIINLLMGEYGLEGRFSISATSRAPRGEEQNGVHYHFLTEKEFIQKIEEDAFVEYEQVYEGLYYGTLRSEIDSVLDAGENVILDIDVKGAANVKQIYGDEALLLFIMPPSLQHLRERLEARATDSPEKIKERLAKASIEIGYSSLFDHRITNDNLRDACQETHQVITRFLQEQKEILLFPGSFNPIHVGHLGLINYVMQSMEPRFDQAWLMLTPTSPFKQEEAMLDEDQRADWIEYLIANKKWLKLSRDESSLPTPHYTYETIRYLQATYPKHHFTLLIGADSWLTFSQWYRSTELLQLIKILIYPRPGYPLPNISTELTEVVDVISNAPLFDISSTQLRQLIREGKYLPYLLGFKGIELDSDAQQYYTQLQTSLLDLPK